MRMRYLMAALLMSMLLTACGADSGRRGESVTGIYSAGSCTGLWEDTVEQVREAEKNIEDMITSVDFGGRNGTYKVTAASGSVDTIKVTLEILKIEIGRLTDNLRRCRIHLILDRPFRKS